MILRSKDHVNKLFDSINRMQGKNTSTQIKEELDKKESEQDKANDISLNKIPIPHDFFTDYKEVNY
jgi:hypothetical protein